MSAPTVPSFLRTMQRYFLYLAVTVLAIGASAAAADPPAETARGLLLRFASPEAPNKTLSAERARLISLFVAPNKAPSPLVQPGPFVATWSGSIDIDLRDYYVFHATGHGHLTMEVAGEKVLEAELKTDQPALSEEVRLSGKRLNPIKVTLRSDSKGAASLRLLWKAEEIPLEPVQPQNLRHVPTNTELMQDNRIRRGRELFANLRCIQCHQDDPGSGAMIELSADSPDLSDAAGRYNRPWLYQWILNPHKLRPNARMPRLLHGNQAPQQAADIVSYLLEGQQNEKPVISSKKTMAYGQALYTGLGCNACHTLKPMQKPDPYGRTPHHLLAAKWRVKPLVAFLKKPSTHYKWIRMPDFKLSDLEATVLAHYLMANSKSVLPNEPNAPKGDPARGKKLFASVGCANCHTSNPGKVTPTLSAAPLEELSGKSGGCLNPPAQTKTHPDHRLPKADREALASFLNGHLPSLKRSVPSAFAMRQIENLRCVACHKFDGELSDWTRIKDNNTDLNNLHELAAAMRHDNVGDKQDIPSMTWFGEKFRPSWMKQFITGTSETRKPRPGLLARMPAFPTRGAAIAEGLAQAHGHAGSDPPRRKLQPKLVKVGTDLAGISKGLNCNSCHAVNGKPAAGGAPLQTIDFKLIPRRLRYDYYQRWMMLPQRIEPTTMMPAFAPGGKNQLLDYFEGNGPKQFEAMWHYMRSLDQKKIPKSPTTE